MDMLIQAFSIATLQNCKALLLELPPTETIGEAVKTLSAVLDSKAVDVEPPTRELIHRTVRICTSCSRKTPMRKAKNDEGLDIWVCPWCRYSEVE